MHIERAIHADDELVAAVARLLPQLTPRAGLPTREDLERMVTQPSTHLLIARGVAQVAMLGWLDAGPGPPGPYHACLIGNAPRDLRRCVVSLALG